MSRFVILSHGKCSNCHEGNHILAKTLNLFNFANVIADKTSTQCSNNICNKSFLIITTDLEFDRLCETVIKSTKASFTTHSSLRELVMMNYMIHKNLRNKDFAETGVQTEVVAHCSQSSQTLFEECDKQPQDIANKDNQNQVSLQSAVSEETSGDEIEIIGEVQKESTTNNKKRQGESIEVKKEVIEEESNSDERLCIERSAPITEIIKEEIDSPIRRGHEERVTERSLSDYNSTPTIKRKSTVESKTITNNTMFHSNEHSVKRPRMSWTFDLLDFECQGCLFMMTSHTAGEIYNHIIEEHTDTPRYKCQGCGERFKLSIDAKRHISKDHNNNEKIIFDGICSEYLTKLHEKCMFSFPDLFKYSKPVTMKDVIRGLTIEAVESAFPKISLH